MSYSSVSEGDTNPKRHQSHSPPHLLDHAYVNFEKMEQDAFFLRCEETALRQLRIAVANVGIAAFSCSFRMRFRKYLTNKQDVWDIGRMTKLRRLRLARKGVVKAIERIETAISASVYLDLSSHLRLLHQIMHELRRQIRFEKKNYRKSWNTYLETLANLRDISRQMEGAMSLLNDCVQTQENRLSSLADEMYSATLEAYRRRQS